MSIVRLDHVTARQRRYLAKDVFVTLLAVAGLTAGVLSLL